VNCLKCRDKSCRRGVSCGRETRSPEETAEAYGETDVQDIVRAAAGLVDGGRAGTLSRLEELGSFAAAMGYGKIALAYCFGMEREAEAVAGYLRGLGFRVSGVSCTAGAVGQDRINRASSIGAVGCNPLQQAREINAGNPDLTVTMGLCLGHDILFNREIAGDVTNLVVKDRVHGHAPLSALEALPSGTPRRYTGSDTTQE
jgi:uncharacterized metal-binding protein